MLTDSGKVTLYRLGFTKFEIETYHSATDPLGNPQPYIDLDSPVWVKVQRSRVQRVNKLRKEWFEAYGKPMQRRQLDTLLNSWYAQHPLADPWEWLKKIYKRGKGSTGQQVADSARRKKAARRTKGFGKFSKPGRE